MATGTENNPLGGTNPHGHFIQPATMGRGIARSASKCASAIQRMAHRRKWNLIMKGDLDSSNSVNSSTSQGCLPGPYCLKSFQAIPCNCHALITPKIKWSNAACHGQVPSMPQHAVLMLWPYIVSWKKEGTPARPLVMLSLGRACPGSIWSLAGEHFWKRSSPARQGACPKRLGLPVE